MGLIVCVPSQEDEQGLPGQSDALLARLGERGASDRRGPRPDESFLPDAALCSRRCIFARTALRSGLSFVWRIGDRLSCQQGPPGKAARPRHVLGPQGLAPGEAAAAIVLAQQPETDSLAVLAGMGTADEPSILQRDRPNRGRGLVSAIDKALAEARLANPIFSALVPRHGRNRARDWRSSTGPRPAKPSAHGRKLKILCPYNSSWRGRGSRTVGSSRSPPTEL